MSEFFEKRIRMATLDDCRGIREVYKPYVEKTWLTTEDVLVSQAVFRERLLHVMDRHPCLVAEVNNKIIGYCYAQRHRVRPAYDWNAELSIYIDTAWSGHRIGTVLYRLLINILRMQEVRNLYALVVCGNRPSELLHKKVGFEFVTAYEAAAYKRGRWLTLLEFEQRIGDFATPPNPFVPIKNISEAVLQDFCDEATAELAHLW